MYDKEIQEILNKLLVFGKMYAIIRLVDPIAKKVVSYKDNTVCETSVRCFEAWEKEKICDNCISIRAFNENKTFVKVEYSIGKVYMVTAIPYELEDRRVVIELLQDTTDSMLFGNGERENSSELYAMIDNMNSLILKDPLTGVYNRRYINEKLPIDLINAVLSEHDISVIMVDIDFFKKVNDNYGHLAGDEVLISFANTIHGCLKRESDWVSRFGGEEFLVCMPGARVEKAIEIAEEMRRQVEAKEIVFKEDTIKITASFGVCTMRPVQGSTIDSFIECADNKLYDAKNNGRNRIEY